ncbi:sugar ABC transporter ATP-binding protein [Salinisphaera sp. USBA-960]|uniref:ATP-binding cassette domain-containing protein n=1 Tax=Salinisphaera orenii TaxID=856731 RepID=UPI000DBE99ED|nr:sugar ABC transporter ATP-binding protein [Salifodinibacter halophilus]NNC25815.1 sugar ABC transporter ATP-binding protein [Salifodinibacter halophilus]
MRNSTQSLLEANNIAKEFGTVTALQDVSLNIGRGEVLGLLGDNGAGKSTLMKILCGLHQPTRGELIYDGEPVSLKSVTHARSLGIDCVHQDLALIPQLNVYHNMFLQRESLTGGPMSILRNKPMRDKARECLADIGVEIPSVDVPIGKLSGGQRQAIAVARSVYSNAQLLLLDEPTAAMGAKEGAMILDVINRLKEKGDVSIIIIAHNYGHIFDVCDRVNLIQDGQITFNRATADTSIQELTDIVVNQYRQAAAKSA